MLQMIIGPSSLEHRQHTGTYNTVQLLQQETLIFSELCPPTAHSWKPLTAQLGSHTAPWVWLASWEDCSELWQAMIWHFREKMHFHILPGSPDPSVRWSEKIKVHRLSLYLSAKNIKNSWCVPTREMGLLLGHSVYTCINYGHYC